jgi:hypothetical protein
VTNARRDIVPVILLVVALACSPQSSSSKPAAPPPSTPATGPAASGTTPSDCGPPVADQVDNVRAAVLEFLITRAASDALQHQVALGPIVLAEEERKPGAGIFVHDVSPEMLQRFAGRTPPVANYSSMFTVENGRTVRAEAPVAFSTGAICWTSPSRALVDARKLSNNAHQPYRATVEQSDGAWKVTALADRR